MARNSRVPILLRRAVGSTPSAKIQPLPGADLADDETDDPGVRAFGYQEEALRPLAVALEHVRPVVGLAYARDTRIEPGHRGDIRGDRGPDDEITGKFGRLRRLWHASPPRAFPRSRLTECRSFR
jgi:hypothetical protein